MTVPGLQFTGVRVTGKVTKVTPPCPSHFIVNPCSFCDASIYIILIPLKDMPGGRQFFMVNVVRGGGCFLLHPGLTGIKVLTSDSCEGCLIFNYNSLLRQEHIHNLLCKAGKTFDEINNLKYISSYRKKKKLKRLAPEISPFY